MGNRATVIFTDGKESFSPAVYLHWNGGPESIYGFLEELDQRQIRADQEYECARFIQLIGEFFDQDGIGGLSLGVANGPATDSLEDLNKVGTDKGNNGIYLVNRTTKPMEVRRFTEHWTPEHTTIMAELPIEQVKAEREKADSHSYRQRFREFYTKATQGKKIEGH